jgi:hypothetical protein
MSARSIALTALTVAFALVGTQAWADDVTFPAEKFQMCLVARTQMLLCHRSNIGLTWKCNGQGKIWLPRCLEWDTESVQDVCFAWTDGVYYYGTMSKMPPALPSRATEPIFKCFAWKNHGISFPRFYNF